MSNSNPKPRVGAGNQDISQQGLNGMAKNIDLTGANVAFAGKIKGWKKSTIEARIVGLGGTVHKKPGEGTDIFLEGGKASYKPVHKALYHGAAMLDQDAARILLEEGSLPLPEGGLTLDECIGELRSLLDAGESTQTWKALIEIIEKSDPERREEIVTYLTEQLDAWSGLTPHLDSMERVTVGLCDARVMPERWAANWIGGHDAIEYALPRVLKLHGVGLTPTDLGKMFEREDWGSLHTIDIRDDSYPVSFFKKMKKCDALEQIRSVYISCQQKQELKTLGQVEHLSGVTALHLVRSSHLSLTQGALLGAPWVSGVEMLGLVHPQDYKDARTHAANLGNVKTLIVRDRLVYATTAERMVFVLQCHEHLDDHPLLQQIEHLSLCFPKALVDDPTFPLFLAWIDASSEDRAPSLKKIDLSGNQNVSFPDDLSRLLRTLEKNNLHERLEAFVVPRDTAEDVLEKLNREGIPAVRTHR